MSSMLKNKGDARQSITAPHFSLKINNILIWHMKFPLNGGTLVILYKSVQIYGFSPFRCELPNCPFFNGLQGRSGTAGRSEAHQQARCVSWWVTFSRSLACMWCLYMFILGITIYFWLLCDRILIRLLEKWCGYLLELRLTPFKIDVNNKCRSNWFWDIWETYRQIGFMGMGSSWILNKWPVLSADG